MTLAKVNIDDNLNLPSKYGVQGYRHSCFSKAEKWPQQEVGALPKSKLKIELSLLSNHLMDLTFRKVEIQPRRSGGFSFLRGRNGRGVFERYPLYLGSI